MKEEIKKFPYVFYILRGAGIFALLMIIKTLMTGFTVLYYTNASGNFQGFPEWAVYLVIVLGELFLYNSLIYQFSYHDRKVMIDFLSHSEGKLRFTKEFKSVFLSKEFLTETAVILALSTLFALFGAFPEFSRVFSKTVASGALLSAMPHFFIIPLFTLIGAYSRYEVRRKWHWLDYTGRLERVFSIPKLIFTSIFIFFGYSIIWPSVPIILLPILLIFGLAGTLFVHADLIGALITIAAIAAIIAFILFIIAMKAVRTRKKLIKKLVKVAKESGYELSPISRPYASLFKAIRESNFTLKLGDKVFTCRIIGSWWQRAPLFFVSDKHAYYLHRIGSREHHFEILSEFCYDFDGEGEKIIILNPVPKKAFVTKDSLYVEIPWYDSDKALSAVRGTEYSNSRRFKKRVDDDIRRLEPGDKIWNYTLYNTTGFIGAVDRKCLGRSNGMFD